MVNKAHNLPPYTFGVEIETFGVHGAVLAWALRNAGLTVVGTFAEDGGNGQTRRTAREQGAWDLGEDGSIRGKNPIEIRSPILSGIEGLKEVEKVCRVLKQVGSEVNASCGLHVHIGILNAAKQGIKPFTSQEVLTVIKRYQTWEKSIDSFLASGRREDKNEYCLSTGRLVGVLQPEIEKALGGGPAGPALADAAWAQANTMNIRGCDCANCVEQALVVENRRREDQYRRNTGRRVDLAKPETLAPFGEHYDRVSVQPLGKYGTIEFRQHHGTINAKEITNWIRFLINHIEVSRRICATTPAKVATAPATAAPAPVEPKSAKPVKDRDVLMGLPTSARKHFKGQATRFAPRPRRPRTAATAAVPAPPSIDAPIGRTPIAAPAAPTPNRNGAAAPRPVRPTFQNLTYPAPRVPTYDPAMVDELAEMLSADLATMGPSIDPIPAPPMPTWTAIQTHEPEDAPDYWRPMTATITGTNLPGWNAYLQPGSMSVRYEPTTTVRLTTNRPAAVEEVDMVVTLDPRYTDGEDR
jgi:hypothetical protein